MAWFPYDEEFRSPLFDVSSCATCGVKKRDFASPKTVNFSKAAFSVDISIHFFSPFKVNIYVNLVKQKLQPQRNEKKLLKNR